jgi:hypothetical protein
VNPRQGVGGKRNSALRSIGAGRLDEPQAAFLKQVFPLAVTPRHGEISHMPPQVHADQTDVLLDQPTLLVGHLVSVHRSPPKLSYGNHS